jgi:S-DNA-T family DNA segregation ATPase FtsK/SpoIIIE
VSQATRAGQLTLGDYLDRAWREGAMWTLMCAAAFLVVALASYSPGDPGWSFVGDSDGIANAGGRFGAWFADLALFVFGVFAYLLPLMVAWSAYLVFRQRAPEPETKLYWLALRWVGFVLLITAGAALANIYFPHLMQELPNGIGGGLGLLVTEYAEHAFGPAGAPLTLSALFLVGFMFATGLSPLDLVDGLGGLTLAVFRMPVAAVRALGRIRLPRLRRARPEAGDDEPDEFDAPDAVDDFDTPATARRWICWTRRARAIPRSSPAQLEPCRANWRRGWQEFGVVAEVVAVHPGPVVALFELELAPGMKVSKITGLAKDIARALSKVSVRVVEVIPGKSVIGLEVPNDHREMVC